MGLQLRIQTKDQLRSESLYERLVREWHDPQPENEEPIIIEESPAPHARTSHVYVVWSAWIDLTPLERSKIIMHAFEQNYGRDLALNVTLAMGLTPDEARVMRLEIGQN